MDVIIRQLFDGSHPSLMRFDLGPYMCLTRNVKDMIKEKNVDNL